MAMPHPVEITGGQSFGERQGITSEQVTAFCAVSDDKKETTYAYVSWRVNSHPFFDRVNWAES
jgi:hypothetical protein